MTNLLDIPNEILISIFEALATIDLQSLVISQLVNRRFHLLIQDAIFNIQNSSVAGKQVVPEETGINPLWITKFKGLFNTTDCFTSEEKKRLAYLSLNGDYTLPFRRLSWAQTTDGRETYIRPEASWRNLSLTFGRAPITHLDVVKSYSGSGGDLVHYYQVDLPQSGMMMGLFYDILLCNKATYGRETGGWEFIVGKRLRSYDVLAEYECFIPDDRTLVDFDEETRQSAVLYVRGGPTSYNEKAPEESWVISTPIEHQLLSWQGPMQNFFFTGYYD
ncbi:hypothetical protein M426DRAFT_27276 [Hypoxylon sp. CI-4A]|nr:hypothetical protein M426DRAFT_27276 [Hypoxylon sp. CI-4A]